MELYKRSQLALETLRNVAKGSKQLRGNLPVTPSLSEPEAMGMGWWCRRIIYTLRIPFTLSPTSRRGYYNRDAKGHNFLSFRTKLLLALNAGGLGIAITITLYLRNQEIIPYTNRTHLVLKSVRSENDSWEILFNMLQEGIFKGLVLPADHPKTLRVNSIARNLIKALEGRESQMNPDLASYDQLKIEIKRSKLSWKRGRAQPDTRHLECLNWEVIVVNLPFPDAHCIPAGKILVTNGALVHFETDAQIAALIAHEVGHLVARHKAELWTKELWKIYLKKVFKYILPPSVVGMISFLKSRPSSTEIEIEATYIGLILMALAGYDPNAAMTTYDKMGTVSRSMTFEPCMLRSEVRSQTRAMEKAMKLYRAKNEITISKVQNAD